MKLIATGSNSNNLTLNKDYELFGVNGIWFFRDDKDMLRAELFHTFDHDLDGDWEC